MAPPRFKRRDGGRGGDAATRRDTRDAAQAAWRWAKAHYGLELTSAASRRLLRRLVSRLRVRYEEPPQRLCTATVKVFAVLWAVCKLKEVMVEGGERGLHRALALKFKHVTSSTAAKQNTKAHSGQEPLVTGFAAAQSANARCRHALTCRFDFPRARCIRGAEATGASAVVFHMPVGTWTDNWWLFAQ